MVIKLNVASVVHNDDDASDFNARRVWLSIAQDASGYYIASDGIDPRDTPRFDSAEDVEGYISHAYRDPAWGLEISEGSPRTFRLIGRATVLQLVKRGLYSNIDCVLGHTLDGKHQTVARVADIEWLS